MMDGCAVGLRAPHVVRRNGAGDARRSPLRRVPGASSPAPSIAQSSQTNAITDAISGLPRHQSGFDHLLNVWERKSVMAMTSVPAGLCSGPDRRRHTVIVRLGVAYQFLRVVSRTVSTAVGPRRLRRRQTNRLVLNMAYGHASAPNGPCSQVPRRYASLDDGRPRLRNRP